MTDARPPAAVRPSSDASMVALDVVDFLIRTEMERLRLFRRHLRATVTRVSPLLLELAVLEGIALADALSLIHPPEDWPWRPLYDDPPALVRRSQRHKGYLGSPSRHERGRFRRAFANPGVVIREVDHPRGRFAVRPCGGVLGFTAAVGPCLLSAFGASAMLKLPEALPETLTLALPGRPLGQLVDHPAFRDRGYRIVRVAPDLVDGLPVVTFRAPLVSFRMSEWMSGDGGAVGR